MGYNGTYTEYDSYHPTQAEYIELNGFTDKKTYAGEATAIAVLVALQVCCCLCNIGFMGYVGKPAAPAVPGTD